MSTGLEFAIKAIQDEARKPLLEALKAIAYLGGSLPDGPANLENWDMYTSARAVAQAAIAEAEKEKE